MRMFIRPLTALAIAASSFVFSSCGSSDPPPKQPTTQTIRVAYKPLITIRNDYYKSIMVGVKGPETRFFSIPARSTKTVSLSSGSYKYAATAKNSNTISGYKHFERNRSYSLNFGSN